MSKEKLKNTVPKRQFTLSPLLMIGSLCVLILVFISGFVIGGSTVTVDCDYRFLATNIAIQHANETIEVLTETSMAVTEQTQVVTSQQPNPLDLTHTAIAVQNSTTEALIYATQTVSANSD